MVFIFIVTFSFAKVTITIKISENLSTQRCFSVEKSVRYLLLLYTKYAEDTSPFFIDCTIFKAPMFSLSLPLVTLPIKCKSNYIAHLILLLNHETKTISANYSCKSFIYNFHI